MAATGVPYIRQSTVREPLGVVRSRLAAAPLGLDGHQVEVADDHTVVVRRRYLPTPLIVVAVAGAIFFFGLPLLLLFIRSNDELRIVLGSDGVDTVATTSGSTSPALARRLDAILGPPQAAPPAGQVPDADEPFEALAVAAPPRAEVPPPAPARAVAGTAAGTVTYRMRDLTRLRESGAIDDEEYRRRRRQLLDDL